MTYKEFYEKWIENFAGGIPEDELRKYVTSPGNMLWHVFSWELHDKSKYLTGDEARKAYGKACKDGAIYVEVEWSDYERPAELPAEFYSAEMLDGFNEIYVAGKDFKWTYIKTHESDYGPYFMENEF